MPTEALKLSEDEIAFLRFTCNIFFLPESPLYAFEADRREPKLFGPTHDALSKKGLVDAHTWRGKEPALMPLQTVAECDARVLWQRYDGENCAARDFYIAAGQAVEFRREPHHYWFSAPIRERDLVQQVIAQFQPARAGAPCIDLTFSPGEYLVFALFARDVREPQENGDHMTLEEVLAHFSDEPHPPPQAERGDFEKHVTALGARGILAADALGNLALAPHLHDFARGLSSRRYDAFTRYDFIDDEWLIRETTIYPVPGSLFLLSSLADGSVNVRELNGDRLLEVLAQSVATLPDITDNPNKLRQARDFFARA